MYPITSDSFSFALTGSQLRDTLLPSWIHTRLLGGCAGAAGQKIRTQHRSCVLWSVTAAVPLTGSPGAGRDGGGGGTLANAVEPLHGHQIHAVALQSRQDHGGFVLGRPLFPTRLLLVAVSPVGDLPTGREERHSTFIPTPPSKKKNKKQEQSIICKRDIEQTNLVSFGSARSRARRFPSHPYF